MGPWERCLAALAFLTTLPVPGRAGPAEALGCFPFAGGVLGGLLWALAAVLFSLFSPEVAAVFVLFAWLFLTGMLHFDGLLDLADAGLLPAERERRLLVLKDARVGAFALGVGVLHLLLKWRLLTELGPGPWLLFAPLWARALVVPAARALPPLGEGLGRSVARGRVEGAALLGALGLVYPKAALFALAAAGLVYLFATRRLGGVNGDVHGAAIELAEAAYLLALD